MRPLLPAFLLLLVSTISAVSQDSIPKVEMGLGYSYSRASVPNSTSRVNMNGVVVDVVGNVNRWFGAEAEFGTHYHCISGCWIDNIRVDNPDERNDSLSFLAGPKITFNRTKRLSPWVHSLAGTTRISYRNSLLDSRLSTTGLGLAAGGGLDFQVSAVAIRIFQVDFVRFAGTPSSSNNVRVGAGIVIRLGHKRSS